MDPQKLASTSMLLQATSMLLQATRMLLQELDAPATIHTNLKNGGSKNLKMSKSGSQNVQK